MLRGMLSRLSGRPDSEVEQSVLRLLIGSIVLIYCFSPLVDGPDTNPETVFIIRALMVGFVSFSLVNILAILIRPGISPIRRIMAMFVDLGATSYIMSVTGYDGLPLFPIYLWVTMGNGFRYGRPYLLASTAVSVLGFSVVVTLHPYWHSNVGLATSIFIGLTVLPMYFGKLLKQLYDAIDRANEASLAKSRFVANMSHELRTPLNGVIGMTDLLVDTKLDVEQKQIAGTVQSSAHALLDLIEDVLDISKIEAGKVLLDKHEFDLHRLVNDTVHMFRHQSNKKGISTASHVAPAVPFQLYGDRSRLRQILVNLVGNAVKFTQEGRVDLHVDVVQRDRRKAVLRFRVVDSGIGIPMEVQSRIFETFTQADETTTRRYGGSGLGTTIARQLVELMDGRIGLESTPDVGTTFWFEVPFQYADNPEHSDEVIKSLSDMKTLYVGDQPDDLREMTNRWGIQVHAVKNIARAIGHLLTSVHEEEPYSVVVVDLRGLGGALEEFNTTLRAEPTLRDVAVIPICAVEDVAGIAGAYPTVLPLPLNMSDVFNALHVANAELISASNVISLSDRLKNSRTNITGTVLVAEDNEVNRQVIEGILKRGGHQIVVVEDGELALDQLESGNTRFDVMILDMNMPGMGGIDVFKTHRFMDTSNPIPTIILTADATQEALRACEDAGVDAYITKPVDSRKLLDQVARLIVQNDREELQSAGTEEASEDPTTLALTSEDTLNELRSLSEDSDFLGELIGGFERDGIRLLVDLETAVEEADFPRFKDTLHALRGSSSELGCERLVERCRQAQKIKPPDMKTGEAASFAAEITTVFKQTCEALHREDLSLTAS